MKHLLQQAIDCLEEQTGILKLLGKNPLNRYEQLITDLKEALAKDEQSPVAWMHEADNDKVLSDYDVKSSDREEVGGYSIPLYTHPAQRKPLSNYEVREIISKVEWFNCPEDVVIATENAVYEKMGIK